MEMDSQASNVIKPTPDSLEPSLTVSVRFKYRPEQEMFVGATARLKIVNGKYIGGVASPRFEGSNITIHALSVLPPGVPPARSPAETYAVFQFPLTPREVDWLHHSRTGNPPSDILLELQVQAEVAQIAIGTEWARDLKVGSPSGPVNVIGEVGGNPGGAPGRYLLLLGNPNVVDVRVHALNQVLTIPSSSWVRDFVGPLSMGRFLVVELPEPTALVAAGKGNLVKRVNEASKALLKMREDIDKNEWTLVAEHSRPVLELLNKKDLVRPLFATAGLADDKIDALLNGLQSVYTYAHAFHHRVDRAGNVTEAVNAEPEDAYLAFAVSGALLNLVSKKLAKVSTK
jgi:hypothetical protein